MSINLAMSSIWPCQINLAMSNQSGLNQSNWRSLTLNSALIRHQPVILNQTARNMSECRMTECRMTECRMTECPHVRVSECPNVRVYAQTMDQEPRPQSTWPRSTLASINLGLAQSINPGLNQSNLASMAQTTDQEPRPMTPRGHVR